MAADVVVPRADLEMIEDEGHLFVRRRVEQIRAVRLAGIVARVTRRVELAALARRAAVGEGATAVGRRGTWYPVLRLEHVPICARRNEKTIVVESL